MNNPEAHRPGRTGPGGIYVEVLIQAPLERVWELTQDPEKHVRWDVRFSCITPTEVVQGQQHFTYSRLTAGMNINGTGVSVGEKQAKSGVRTSALKFFTADLRSPIRSGSGYWKYVPAGPETTRFITGYDYSPGWGRLPDLLVRPLLGWATAYSFDRLRIWAEGGAAPEHWPLRAALSIWRKDRPRAARCLRAPAGGRRRADHLAQAPTSLTTLQEPLR